MSRIRSRVPYVDRCKDVRFIDVLGDVRDLVTKNQALPALESVKVAMENPHALAGVVEQINACQGERIHADDGMAVMNVGQTFARDDSALDNLTSPVPKPLPVEPAARRHAAQPEAVRTLHGAVTAAVAARFTTLLSKLLGDLRRVLQ